MFFFASLFLMFYYFLCRSWISSIVYLWFAVDPREKTIHRLQHRCRKRRGKNCSTTTYCSLQLSVSSSKIGYLFTTSVMFFFASLFLMFYYFFCSLWRKFSILTGGSWLPSRMLRQSFRYGVQHGCRKRRWNKLSIFFSRFQ